MPAGVQPIRMTPDQAKRLVILGVATAAVLAVVASYRRGRTPSPTIGVGALASGAVLSAIADVQPSIAGGFGLVILVTSAAVVGADAWEGVAAAARGDGAARGGKTVAGRLPKASPDIRGASEAYRSRPQPSTGGGSGGGGGGGGSW